MFGFPLLLLPIADLLLAFSLQPALASALSSRNEIEEIYRGIRTGRSIPSPIQQIRAQRITG